MGRKIASILALYAALLLARSASAYSFTASVSGNTINYSVTTDMWFNCVSVELDHDPTKVQGLRCSGDGSSPATFTGSFVCNTVGTHTIAAIETNGSTIVVFADQTVIVSEPAGSCGLPELVFDISENTPADDRRILLSNTHLTASGVPAYPYPHYQSLLNVDGAIPIDLRVMFDGAPTAGAAVTLTVTDPPDPSRYMNAGPGLQPGPGSHADDNIGPLPTLEGEGLTSLGSNSYAVTSGANGRIETVMRLSPSAKAGDNYQVQARATKADGSTVTGRSGVVTAWKRMFLEKQPMFRRGGPLATDAPAGVTNIIVRKDYISTTGDTFDRGNVIMLLHAPPIGQLKTAAGFYQELNQIRSAHNFTSETTTGPGTVTTNGTAVIVGTHTHFNRLHSDDVIKIDGEDPLYVISIQDHTHLTLSAPVRSSASGLSYVVGDPNLVDHSFHAYRRLELTVPLLRSYGRERILDPLGIAGPNALALNDGVAKLTSGALSRTDYFDSTDSLLQGAIGQQWGNVFPSAYTEYIVLDPSLPRIPVPRMSLSGDRVTQWFVDKWFSTPAPVPTADTAHYPLGYHYLAGPNHQLLLVADSESNNAAASSNAGFTTLAATVPGERVSVLERGTVESRVNNEQSGLYQATVDDVMKRTEVHELVHQWTVNVGPFPSHGDHCTEIAYDQNAPGGPQGQPLFCLMREPSSVPSVVAPWSSRSNPIMISPVEYQYRNLSTFFHMDVAISPTSEYNGIRAVADPWLP